MCYIVTTRRRFTTAYSEGSHSTLLFVFFRSRSPSFLEMAAAREIQVLLAYRCNRAITTTRFSAPGLTSGMVLSGPGSLTESHHVFLDYEEGLLALQFKTPASLRLCSFNSHSFANNCPTPYYIVMKLNFPYWCLKGIRVHTTPQY